jgi:hypothetical protein
LWSLQSTCPKISHQQQKEDEPHTLGVYIPPKEEGYLGTLEIN